MSTIDYPVIYLLYIEHIGGGFYKGRVYWSPKRALQAIKMMHLAQYDDHLFWLHHIQNGHLIGKQRINLKFNDNV